MNHKIQKIVIIGAGSWGKKVTSIIQGNGRFQVSNISARDFLIGTEIINLDQVDLIWICTDQIHQQEVLSSISRTTFEKHLVIEKPFCDDYFELERMIQIKEKSTLLRISSPWTYSKLWNQAREVLVENFTRGIISVIRSGPEQRKYLSPPRDWLFHDLMLLNDLAKNLNSDFSFQNRSSAERRLWENIMLMVNNLEVNLSGGYAENRAATWNASNENKYLNIDFNKKSLLSNIPSLYAQEEEIFMNDSPIINMLEFFETDYQTMEEFQDEMNLLMVL